MANGCFGNVPLSTEQPGILGQRGDGGKHTVLHQLSVTEAFLRSSGHLVREAGVGSSASGRSTDHMRPFTKWTAGALHDETGTHQH